MGGVELHIEFPERAGANSSKGPLWAIGFATAFHHHNLVNKLFGAKVLRQDYGWSRAMLTSFKHFLGHAADLATDKFLSEEKAKIEAILTQMKPLTKTHTESKNESKHKRNDVDSEKLEDMPKNEEIEAACRQAMFDMQYLYDKTRDQKCLTSGQKTAAMS